MRSATDWINEEVAAGRYLILGKLGEGGMGFVYEAHDRNLDCRVVIKVPRRALLDDPEFSRRFDQEIRSLVKLSHPHIVKISDVGQYDDLPFAVMQHLPGGSIDDRIRKGRNGKPLPMPVSDVLGWISQVATAVDFIHRRGYVHRDIKPGNILFDADDNVFLSDFGVAKVVADQADKTQDHAQTGTGLVMGTPDYMAPELILGQPFDGHVDQYALAVMVHELLSGTMPFHGATPAAVMVGHTTQQPPVLHLLVPSIPESVAQVVARGMAKAPQQRFSSCVEFAQALEAAVRGAPGGQAAPPRPRWQVRAVVRIASTSLR
jgi:serine/threonine protein kinase